MLSHGLPAGLVARVLKNIYDATNSQTHTHTHKLQAISLGPSAFCLTFAHVQTPVTMCDNSKSGHWVSLFRWF